MRREAADILGSVCEALSEKRLYTAAAMLADEYPFAPLDRVERRYSPVGRCSDTCDGGGNSRGELG